MGTPYLHAWPTQSLGLSFSRRFDFYGNTDSGRRRLPTTGLGSIKLSRVHISCIVDRRFQRFASMFADRQTRLGFPPFSRRHHRAFRYNDPFIERGDPQTSEAHLRNRARKARSSCSAMYLSGRHCHEPERAKKHGTRLLSSFCDR
jgi:hypothetical protein